MRLGRPVSESVRASFHDFSLGGLALGDVAQEPDASEIAFVAVIERRRPAFDRASVLGLHFVVVFHVAMGVKVMHPIEEFALVLHVRSRDQ